jgi:hypothetical protein
MRNIVLALVLLLSFCSLSAQAFEAIPQGTSWVVFLNNASGIPFSDFVTKNSAIPAKPREMFDIFVKAAGFNPLSDITSLQVMVKMADPRPQVVMVARGKFDVERLGSQIKLMAADKVADGKILELNAIIEKNNRAALCFLDGTLVAMGQPDMVKAFVEAHKGTNVSDSFSGMIAQMKEKVYFAALCADKAAVEKMLVKLEEKSKQRARRPIDEKLRAWAWDFYLAGFSFKSLLVQQMEQSFELKLVYDRADQKDCYFRLMSESNDPRLSVDKQIRDLLEKLPAMMERPSAGASGKSEEKPAVQDEKKEEKKDEPQEKNDDDENE